MSFLLVSWALVSVVRGEDDFKFSEIDIWDLGVPIVDCQPCNMCDIQNGVNRHSWGKWCKPGTADVCDGLGSRGVCVPCPDTNRKLSGLGLFCQPGTATVCSVKYERTACRPCSPFTQNGKDGKWCQLDYITNKNEPLTDKICEGLGPAGKCTKCPKDNYRVGNRNLYCKPNTATVCARTRGGENGLVPALWDVVDTGFNFWTDIALGGIFPSFLDKIYSIIYGDKEEGNDIPLSVFLDWIRKKYTTPSGIDFSQIWKDTGGPVFDALKNVARKLWDAIKSAGGGIKKWFQKYLTNGGFGIDFEKIWNDTSGGLARSAKAIWGGFSRWVELIASGKFKEAWDGLVNTLFCNPVSKTAWIVACDAALTAAACNPVVAAGSGGVLCAIAGGVPGGKAVKLADDAANAAASLTLKSQMKKWFKDNLPSAENGGVFGLWLSSFVDSISKFLQLFVCKKGADEIASAITDGAEGVCTYAIDLLACNGNTSKNAFDCKDPPPIGAPVDLCADHADCVSCLSTKRPNKVPEGQHCVYKDSGFFNPETGSEIVCEASSGMDSSGKFKSGTWLSYAQKKYPNLDLLPDKGCPRPAQSCPDYDGDCSSCLGHLGAGPPPEKLGVSDSCVYRKGGFHNENTCSNYRCESKKWVDFKKGMDPAFPSPEKTCPLPIVFKLEQGADCGSGNDLDCDKYGSKSAIKESCAQDPLCKAYSTNEDKPWCRKSKYNRGSRRDDHHCYYKYQTTASPTQSPTPNPSKQPIKETKTTRILLGVLLPIGVLALIACFRWHQKNGGTCFGSFPASSSPPIPSDQAVQFSNAETALSN